MSGAVTVALLREAFAALPNGTAKERTVWLMKRKAELEAGIIHAPVRDIRASTVQPFSHVADDPVIRRLTEDER